MTTYDERKTQLEEWLGNPYNRGNFRFTKRQNGRASVIFCTASFTYHLSFTDDYLGASASARIMRPGEDWTRGSDLPDGKFGRETFDEIMRAVVAYELVELAPVREPVEVSVA